MNIAYRVFNHTHETPTHVSKKQVFKHAVVNFIQTIQRIRDEYVHGDGLIYLLFDNPTSRVDLQTSFYYASRKQAYAKYKEKRSKEPKEFYNSIGLLKYYYMLLDSSYRTVQISNLEADDLVKPVLATRPDNTYSLLLSNDLDWARYISPVTHWLPGLSGEPDTVETISDRLGFRVTEETLIAYKAVFGDTADDIPRLAPSAQEPYFSELAQTLESADSLVGLASVSSNIEQYPFLQNIREDERQFRINLQLIREIPVSEKHLEYTTTIGRNSETMRVAVEKALGIREANGFTFGTMKRPRVQ